MKMIKQTALLLLMGASTALGAVQVVLDKHIMDLAMDAVKLSNYSYDKNPQLNPYPGLTYYTKEPDQALVGQVNGYCYAAFRGTTKTWSDWQQNFDPRDLEVCGAGNQCCTSRRGFFDAYNTTYRSDLEKAVRDCAKTCKDPNECVVLTGHSQGGSVAAVAGLALSDLNPYVFTFGQPNTINAPCPLIASERWYRFINTKSSDIIGMMYDPVPFVPGLGTDAFGHMLIMSEDSTGLAYIGLDAQDELSPLDVVGFDAHAVVGTSQYPGYLMRLQALTKTRSYPVRSNGYVPGTFCTEDKECESGNCGQDQWFSLRRCIGTSCKQDSDCPVTGRCDAGACVQKLGSCMDCNSNSDCISNKCLLNKCTNPDSGLMDDNCRCTSNADCQSGRCDGLFPPQCQAKLPIGAGCNEDSDCISNNCNWRFQCATARTSETLLRSSASVA